MVHDDSHLEKNFAQLFERFQEAVYSKEFEDAESTANGLFDLAIQYCEENPEPDFLLTILAGDCEENGDWQGAESAYRQILQLPDQRSATCYSAYRDLASLYWLLGRTTDALEQSSLAIAAVRTDDIPLLLAVSLAGHARFLLRQNKTQEARNSITEATSLITEKEDKWHQIQAGLLILESKCDAREEKLEQAEAKLQEAMELLGPWKDFEMASGVQSDLAHWWSVQGMVHSAMEDHTKAVDAWQQAVAIRRQIDTLEHCQSVHNKVAIAWMLRGLADALLSAGDTGEAEAASTEARSILSNIGVPNLEQQF